MIQAALPGIVTWVGKIIDKVVPDKTQANALKQQVALSAMEQDNKELQLAVNVIQAEAGGESWLQRNWRPMTMLTLVSLVTAHWLGYSSETLPPEQAVALLEIVKVGLGGYVLGRSGEKVMKAYKS